jgi:hypothetical protein
MTAVELIQLELKRLRTMLDGSLNGLTPEQLHAVPGGHPKANTIAWGLWHLVRTEDNVVRFVLRTAARPCGPRVATRRSSACRRSRRAPA